MAAPLWRRPILSEIEMKYILSIAVLLGLAACSSSSQSLRRDFVLPVNATEAVIVFSISHDRAHGGLANARFRLREFDTGAYLASYESRRMGGMFNGYHPTELQNVYGRLYAVAVKPGRYQWRAWQLSNAWGEDFRGVGTADDSPVFTARAGEVVYIGNLHVALDIRANDEGVLIPVSAGAELRNEQERDLSLFRRRYSQLSNVVSRVGETGQWSSAAR